MEISTQNIAEIKKATTQYPVSELFKTRYSGRSFTSQKLAETEINTILEAASWAPSSMNEQPWLYRFAENGTEAFNLMLSFLSPGNQIWVKDAPGLILSVGRKTHLSNGQPNAYYMYDVGAANALLLLQAHDLGFTTHIMAGFDHPKANQIFAKEGETQVICFIAIGKQDSPDKLPEPFKTRETNPRSRKTLSEILF